MKLQRYLALLFVTALITGCGEEKQNAPPVASKSDKAAKPGEPTKPYASASDKDAKSADGKKATDEELMKTAKAALEKNDPDSAIKSLEQIIAADPKNREALFMVSRVYQMKGALAIKGGNTAAGSETLLNSAKYAKQLRAAYPKLTKLEEEELPAILYNEACILALRGDTDKAMAALEDSYNSGFKDLYLLITDHDLDKLRSLPKFKTFREDIIAQKSFAFDFSLPDVDGKTIALKDLKGNVVIADIWGTWCPPCRQEIPHFVQLLKKYEGKGLKIVGINYENGSAEQAKKLINDFAKENHMNYPCVIGDPKTQSQVPNFNAFPTTLFIDRNGKVRFCIVGAQPPEVLEAIIQGMLEEKTASLK